MEKSVNTVGGDNLERKMSKNTEAAKSERTVYQMNKTLLFDQRLEEKA